MAGEPADAEVDASEDQHREDHQCREYDEDDRLVPSHRWRIVDRIVSDNPACHDQHTSEEAERDLGEDGPAGLGGECEGDDGYEGVPEPE